MADHAPPLDDFARVVEAWRLSPSLHLLRGGADPAAIDRAEQRLGRQLPASLVEVLRFSDGLAALNGTISVEAVSPTSEEDLVGMSDRLRGSGWPIPDDMLSFGSNGGGSVLGVWYPKTMTPHDRSPVVIVADPTDSDYMAVLGSDLVPFLKTWSAFHLVASDAPIQALDALGLPTELRTSQDNLRRCAQWADPILGDVELDPFEARLDPRQVAQLVERLR